MVSNVLGIVRAVTVNLWRVYGGQGVDGRRDGSFNLLGLQMGHQHCGLGPTTPILSLPILVSTIISAKEGYLTSNTGSRLKNDIKYHFTESPI